MLLATLLFLLSAPLLVFSKIVFGSVTYNGKGQVVIGVTEYSDAPPSFGISLVNTADNTTTPVLSNVISGTGTYTITLPNTPAGSYKIAAVDGSGNVLSTSKPITVGASDFGGSTVTAGTYSALSTGSVKPFVSTSIITANSTTFATKITVTYDAGGAGNATTLVTTPSPTASVANITLTSIFTSGTVTSAVVTEVQTTVSVTPSPVTVVTAATATATTRSTGAASKGVASVVGPLAVAVLAGAMLF